MVSIDRKVKIINILSRMNIGGPSIHTALLTKYLQGQDYHSLIISGTLSEGEGEMSYLLDGIQSKHMTVPSMQREISPWEDLKTVLYLTKIFRREKPQIVHTNMAKAGMVGRVAAWLAGVPVICHTFHGHVFAGYFSPFKTRIFILIERLLARISSRIIAISENIQFDLFSTYRIAALNKIELIPLGFELDKLPDRETYQNFFRTKFSISKNAFIIGIIGRLTEIKNHILFIQVADLLCRQHNDVHFLVIGDGELHTELVNYVKKLNLSDKIHFTGWIQETAKIYSDLDLLIQTSKNEGTPVTIIEAMWYRIPVLSTNVGGVPDLISDGETGYLLDSTEPAVFVTVIEKLLQNKKLRDKIGLTAHEFINQKYHVNRLINDIKALYKRLLAEK